MHFRVSIYVATLLFPVNLFCGLQRHGHHLFVDEYNATRPGTYADRLSNKTPVTHVHATRRFMSPHCVYGTRTVSNPFHLRHGCGIRAGLCAAATVTDAPPLRVGREVHVLKLFGASPALAPAFNTAASAPQDTTLSGTTFRS